MLNNILNGTSRTGSSTTARGSYQGRSGITSTGPTTPTGISVVEKKGDNYITVRNGENSYRIENKTAQEFLNETKGYSSAQREEYAKMLSDNQAATNTYTTPPPTDGTTTTTPPTDTGDTTTTTPPPTDTGGGTTTEEESDNTLMYILIAAIVGVALFPTGKKKKKKK